MVAEGMEHGTAVLVPAVAGGGDPGQFLFQSLQAVDPVAQAGLLPAGDVMGPVQGGAIGPFERDQRRDVVQRQAQIAGVTDKAEPLQRGAIIAALIAFAAGSGLQQALVLVKPDGGDLDAGAPRHFADGKHELALEALVTREIRVQGDSEQGGPSMPHDHSHHHHHHVDQDAGDARVAWAVAVNMALTVAQIIGGILSGSLALIADALHNFSDAISLVIAFFARKVARRPADARMSFGYGRAEAVAALVNYTTLVVLALYLIYEGVMRFLEPEPVDGWLVVWIAVLALVIDVATALLTYSLSKDSMNIRAAFLHNVADALGSVAVIVAGTAVIIWGWTWVDPLVTLMIAGYILWHVRAEVGEVFDLLMLAGPDGLAAEKVADAIEAVDGVEGVHHVHLWAMQEQQPTLEAHLVISEADWSRADAVKAAVKQVLRDEFGIGHSTLELECPPNVCVGEVRFGHAG